VPTASLLATADDLASRLGRDLTPAEEARGTVLLGDASARIRRWTRQDFTLVTDDEQVLRGPGGEIRLLQRPVLNVTKVVALGGNGLPDVTLADWLWDGIDLIRIGTGNMVINLPEVWWDDDGYPGTYRVTNSHGYTDTPDDVVAVACQMVLRTLTNPSMAGGVTGETIGPYSYRLDAPGGGLSVTMTKQDRDDLVAYRPKTHQIQVRRG
jgi:hypothetical protein